MRAIATRRGPIGLIHFDTHTDTGAEVFGVELSHGSIMYRLVEQGHVDGSRYVQIGLRGYWPGETEFSWQREHGITSLFMHDVRDRGIRSVVEEALTVVGDGPVFLSVDVDVLDPAFAPGTGTPEPGGMTSRRPAVGLPRDLLAGRARRDGRRRGRADRGRLGGHHRAGRGPDRPRGDHGGRATPRRLSASSGLRVRVRSSCFITTLAISLRISGGPLALT